MLRISLRPSRVLAAVLCAAHAAGAATLVPLDVPLWLKVVLAALVTASLARSLGRQALLKSRASPLALELRGDDRAAVQMRDAVWHDARILPTTYVTPLISVLNLRLAGRVLPFHVVILPDSVRPEEFRRLRVRLRWGYRVPQ